jgi:hypothetical protein
MIIRKVGNVYLVIAKGTVVARGKSVQEARLRAIDNLGLNR